MSIEHELPFDAQNINPSVEQKNVAGLNVEFYGPKKGTVQVDPGSQDELSLAEANRISQIMNEQGVNYETALAMVRRGDVTGAMRATYGPSVSDWPETRGRKSGAARACKD